jgi:sugar lactone lactonase YvrE
MLKLSFLSVLPRFRHSTPLLALAVLLLTSCTRTSLPPVALVPVQGAAFQGMVHGGQQPVGNSTVQLYAVGTGGDGSVATPLLSHLVQTSASGNFGITGLYTCPSASTLVYITSTGGDPGLGTNNPDIALMTALGPCGNLKPSTFITINEVTTVASVFALAPYMQSFGAIGYGTDLASITDAFNEVNELVNVATGVAGGPSLPAGQGVSVEQIDALADILASCINSAGGSAGDGSVCGKLFTYTGGVSTANTIAAMLQIARNPTANIAELYSLISPNSPFFPVLPSPPSTWNIAPAPLAAAPQIAPGAGTYSGTQSITITDATSGATIYYTTDGTQPNLTSPVYGGPFTLAASGTVKAFATASGYASSPLVSNDYVITPSSSSSGTGIISTVAGNGADPTGQGLGTYAGDGGQATSASVSYISSVALDGSGNIYIADTQNFRVRKVTAAGIISTVAGTGQQGYSGDGGQATSAAMSRPFGVALDNTGTLYIADYDNQVVRKVDANGIISSVAGNGQTGYSGDGAAATSAALHGPYALAFDTANNLLIADRFNHVVRRVTPAGTIATIAGNTSASPSGDGGPATSAGIGLLSGVAADSLGNVYVDDEQYGQIRKVDSSGIITRVAGSTTPAAFAGQDGGLAINAWLGSVSGVAVDAANNVYFTDEGSGHIRKVDTAGIISTVAGNGSAAFNGDGGPALSAALNSPQDVAVESDGTLYIADSANFRVRKVTYGTQGSVATPTFSPGAGAYATGQTVALSSATSGAAIYYTTDGSTPTASSYPYTSPIYIAASGTLQAIAVKSGNTTSSVASASYVIGGTPATPTILPVAGTYTTAQTVTITSSTVGAAIYYTTDGSPVTTGATLYPGPFTVSASETVRALALGASATSGEATATYVINVIPGPGMISTIAGEGPGNAGYSGDGGPATSASINFPTGVGMGSGGVVYVADTQNNVIRKVYPGGAISTMAGNGTQGYSGDGGSALSASLYSPSGVATDGAGNLYIADAGNNVIRKVTPAGIISTFAGNGGQAYSGDGGLATSASLFYPTGVATDASGNVYIADYQNNVVRRVNSAGTISTIAGNGNGDYTGDGGPATSAALQLPGGVAIDSAGNLYIADTANSVVRTVTPSGVISTFAGGGDPSSLGDGGAATAASLQYPTGVAVDTSKNLYISDAGTSLIRKVISSTGIISTVAGSGASGYNGDGILAVAASLDQPGGVAVDSAGDIFIADTTNNRVREVSFSSAGSSVAAPIFSPSAGTYTSTQSVSVTSTTSGAAIYYTTDGSTPTAASTLYTGAVVVSASETLQAVAIGTGNVASSVTTGSYVITPATPTPFPIYSPAGGTFTTAQTVTITPSSGNPTIYYTLDGSTPTTSSSVYSGPITVSRTERISAIAISNGLGTSAIYIQDYTIQGTVAPGIITTVAGGGQSQSGNPPTTAAQLVPQGGVMDSVGNLYIVDTSTQPSTIQRVDAVTGAITQLNTSLPGGYADFNTLVRVQLVIDSQDNLYFNSAEAVWQLQAANGYIGGNIVAGSGQLIGAAADGGPANLAFLPQVQGIGVDSSNNLYISSLVTFGNTTTGVIRKVDAVSNIITTVAGSYTASAQGASIGDGGLAINAPLTNLLTLAVAPSGDLYLGDRTNLRVRKVDAKTGIISTVAGNGTYGYTGDGGPATAAGFLYVGSITLDPAGNLFIRDTYGFVVRKVDAQTGIITTIAGNGIEGFSGDGGPAISAELEYEQTQVGLSTDRSGNLYIADNNRLRKVTPGGTASAVTGVPQINFYPYISYNIANSGAIVIPSPMPILLNSSTAGAAIYYTTDGATPTTSSTLYNGSILISNPETLKAIAVAPGYTPSAVTSQVFIGQVARPVVSIPSGNFIGAQTLTVTDATPSATITYSTFDPITYTIAGPFPYTGPITVSATENIQVFATKSGLADAQETDAQYVIYPLTVDSYDGIITTVAGSGPGVQSYPTSGGFDGDGGSATAALLSNPTKVAVGTEGTIYIPDTGNHRIRKVTPQGIISTIAGTGDTTATGDGGPATAAAIGNPGGIVVDPTGIVYFSDGPNNRVRKIAVNGTISTIAGNGTAAFRGDGGPGASASLNDPYDLAIASDGTLYISDVSNSRIRKVTPDGTISTVVGCGCGYTANPDGLQATAISIHPGPLAFDTAGNLLFVDAQSVRKVNSSGVVSTIAGKATGANTGLAIDATFIFPAGIAVDPANNLYISDAVTYTVYKVNATGTLATFAGSGALGFSGDGDYASIALIAQQGIAIDANSNLYMADTQNHRIRKVSVGSTLPQVAAPIPFGAQGLTYTGGVTLQLYPGTSGSSMYYTTDGSTPTAASIPYPSNGINVGVSETVKVIAVKPGYTPSPVLIETYTIIPTPAPVFSLAAGTYATAQTVTISGGPVLDGTGNVIGPATGPIFYTTDGSTPTQNSIPYFAPILVSASKAIRAVQMTNSIPPVGLVGAATYVITAPGVPTITSVSAIAAQRTQTITVAGSGFGTHAAYTGSSFYISLWDDTVGSFEAGYGGDGVGLVITSWTNTQIVLQGYDSGYGGYYQIANADHLRLSVWNAQIDRTGLYDPSAGNTPGSCTNIIVGGGATTCH